MPRDEPRLKMPTARESEAGNQRASSLFIDVTIRQPPARAVATAMARETGPREPESSANPPDYWRCYECGHGASRAGRLELRVNESKIVPCWICLEKQYESEIEIQQWYEEHVAPDVRAARGDSPRPGDPHWHW